MYIYLSTAIKNNYYKATLMPLGIRFLVDTSHILKR